MNPDPNTIFTDPMSVFAFLATLVAVIFWLSGVRKLQRFFEFLPPVIFVYFLPMICTTLGITPSSSDAYDFTTRFFLPIALFLLMISIDLKSVAKLGPVALFMVTAGTVGIVLGGQLAAGGAEECSTRRRRPQTQHTSRRLPPPTRRPLGAGPPPPHFV